MFAEDNISLSDLIPVTILFLTFLSIFTIAELWHRFLSPPSEITRKFIHISSGILIACFPWIIQDKVSIFILGILVGSVLAVCRHYHLLKSLHSVKRHSLGELYYLIAVVFLFVVAEGQPLFYFISIMILTVSDGLAAVLGSVYQRVIYSVEKNTKSLEGSVAFFVTTFLVVHIPLLLCSDVSRLNSILIAVQVALIATLIEAICFNGFDNIMIPIISYYLLIKLVKHDPNHIIWILSWQLVLLVMTYIIAWKMEFLALSGALVLQLFLFGALTWGGPIWVVPILIAMSIYMIAYTLFTNRCFRRYHRSYQVNALVHFTIVAGAMFILRNAFRMNHLDGPSYLGTKNSFYPLYVGALSTQLTIGLFRLNWLYRPRYEPTFRSFIKLCVLSILIVVPISIWLQYGFVYWFNILLPISVTFAGSTIFYFLYMKNTWTQKFPWEFRVQSISVAAGILPFIPLYIWLLHRGYS